ncbi:MAG TPA: hypothetical protein VN751_02325, partial [Solirubrobacteraceae bacterium]|nr:hypothetical protein [Solirubrobacteraceae bacterium]
SSSARSRAPCSRRAKTTHPKGLRAQAFTLGARLKTTAAAAGAALAGAIAFAPTATQLLLVGACPVAAGVVGGVLLVRGGRHEPLVASPPRGITC